MIARFSRLMVLGASHRADPSGCALDHKTDTERDDTRHMHDPVDINELIRDPAARRLWLLYNSAKFLPFGDALELARAADRFVSASVPESPAAEASSAAMQPNVRNPIVERNAADIPDGSDAAAHKLATVRNGHFLSGDERDRLLTYLAEGAKNADLAVEFGLTPKQVQGFRIGCAREIARRRAYAKNGLQIRPEAATTAIIDDIVRYLRQRDDVVVPQEDGGYLVNGRFRMTASELVVRANRMRTREKKPMFEVSDTAIPAPAPASKSHPMFWEETPATEPRAADGSHA